MLHRLANDYQIEGNEILQNNDYLREYLSINDKQIIKRWCIRRIEEITGGIKMQKTGGVITLQQLQRNILTNITMKRLVLKMYLRQ